MRRWVVVVALALFAAVGCSKQNSAFCCATEADCTANGVTDGLRPCDVGLACIDNSCEVASCATDGCEAAAPVCDLTSDMCSSCIENADCSRFAATPLCEPMSGGCVQCVMNADCSGTTPVCDANACRACRVDSDCPSGACGEDGSCIAESEVLYVSPQGTDTPPCARAMPCRDPAFALQQITETRTHLVFTPGAYTTNSAAATSTAASVTLHGGGATVTGGNADSATFRFGVPATLHDLEVINPDVEGFAINTSATTTLQRVTLRAPSGVASLSSLTASDLTVHARGAGVAIRNAGTVKLDRAHLNGGAHGIVSTAGTIDVTNALITNTTGVGLDFESTSGTVRFSTIANTGTATTGTQPFGASCSTSGVTFRSSIIWTAFPVNPNTREPVYICSLFDGGTIVGPKPVGGAASTDPSFIDAVANNFHLNGNSPARDKVDTGPTVDFEGDPRPRGARFDVGADEAP